MAIGISVDQSSPCTNGHELPTADFNGWPPSLPNFDSNLDGSRHGSDHDGSDFRRGPSARDHCNNLVHRDHKAVKRRSHLRQSKLKTK